MSDRHQNPWRTLKRAPLYENPWIKVREDQVMRPDGAPGIYGVVEFKNRAVGIVPVTEDGDTFLVGQYRYALDMYSWEVPEGGSPAGEAILEGARRELSEETGITAERWTYLGELYMSNSITNETGAVFLAEDLSFGDSHPEGTEQLELRRIPLKEAYEMAMRGEITDALAIVSLSRAWAYLRSGRKLKPMLGPLAP